MSEVTPLATIHATTRVCCHDHKIDEMYPSSSVFDAGVVRSARKVRYPAQKVRLSATATFELVLCHDCLVYRGGHPKACKVMRTIQLQKFVLVFFMQHRHLETWVCLEPQFGNLSRLHHAVDNTSNVRFEKIPSLPKRLWFDFRRVDHRAVSHRMSCCGTLRSLMGED